MNKLKYFIPSLIALIITVGSVYAFDGYKKGEKNIDPATFANKQAQMAEMKTKMDAMQQAIDSADYQAWAGLAVGTPMAEKINADNFDRFVEMHRLMKEAKAIGDELGLSQMGHMGYGGHQGLERGPILGQ